MAIIAQHVPVPGCSVAEVLRWKVQLPESAERQVAESAQMFSHSNTGGRSQIGGRGRRSPTALRCTAAVDTTLVSALHGDVRPRRGASERDGAALLAARKRKEQSYPEFLGASYMARLVVLAVEVGGRFSRETSGFITELARARARSETVLMRKRGG